MKKFLILLALMPGWTLATQNTWVKMTSFNYELERAVSFSIGNYGYAGTGQDSADQMHNEFWKYDPVLNAWSQVGTLPAVGRRNAIAFVIDNKGYVGTGCDAAESMVGNNLKDLWEYDPVGNIWTPMANFPGAMNMGIYFSTGFTCSGKGYICCGKISPSYYSNELWEYKPSTNQWLQRASFPGGTRYQLSSLVIDDVAYVGLGTDENYYMDDWWKYNPATNTWTQLGDFPGTDRASASTFTIGPRGFVAFGSDGGFLEDVWEYNPWNDSWSIRAPFPGGDRRNAISFSINGKGYAGTGKGSAGIRRNFYEYTPLTPTDIVNTPDEGVVTIYPNPAAEIVQIIWPGKPESVNWKLYTCDGKLLMQGKSEINLFSLDVHSIPRGTCLLTLTGNSSFRSTHQILNLQ